MIITVFIQNSCNLVNKRIMICVVCPVEIQFSVIFIQLGAKVEGATSKNDTFHVLGPLDSTFQLVQGENDVMLTWWLPRNI